MKKTTLILLCLGLFLNGCAAKRNAFAPIAYQQEIEEVQKTMDRGNSLQAIDDLSVLIQMNPKDTNAIFLRGVAFQNLDRFDSAVEDFQRVLNIDSKHDKSLYNLGMIYAYKLNEPKLALTYFDRFLDVSPQHKQAFTVAKIMTTLDGPDRLILSSSSDHYMDEVRKTNNIISKRNILEQAIKQSPNSPVYMYLLAQTYDKYQNSDAAGSDVAKAKTFYEKTLQIRPTCAPCRKAYGTLLVREGKLKEGQLQLRKANLFDPS